MREHSFQKWHLSAFNVLSHVPYYLGANTGTSSGEATIMTDAAWTGCSPHTYLGNNYLICKHPHCSGASTIYNVNLMVLHLCVCMHIRPYIHKCICKQQIQFGCWFERRDMSYEYIPWTYSIRDKVEQDTLCSTNESSSSALWKTTHALNTIRKDEETTTGRR